MHWLLRDPRKVSFLLLTIVFPSIYLSSTEYEMNQSLFHVKKMCLSRYLFSLSSVWAPYKLESEHLPLFLWIFFYCGKDGDSAYCSLEGESGLLTFVTISSVCPYVGTWMDPTTMREKYIFSLWLTIWHLCNGWQASG